MVTKSSCHAMVEVECLNCSAIFMARKQRVEEGKGKFCSRKCYGEWMKENTNTRIGYENATVHFDKVQNRHFVQWVDEDTRKLRSTTWAKWAWETNFGSVPEGKQVRFRDGNHLNITLDNLYLADNNEWNVPPEMTEAVKSKLSKIHKGKTLSNEHKSKISFSNVQRWENGIYDSVHKGENSKYWKGGVHKPYTEEFKKISSFIRDRDNHVCQICGKNVYRSRHGHVHHMDGDKTNNVQENLILLCSSCHSKVHHPNKSTPATILAFHDMLKY